MVQAPPREAPPGVLARAGARSITSGAARAGSNPAQVAERAGVVKAAPARVGTHTTPGVQAVVANPNAGIWRTFALQRLSRMMRLRPPREVAEELEPAIDDIPSPQLGRVFKPGLERGRVRKGLVQ